MGKAEQDKDNKIFDWGSIIRNFLWDFVLLAVLLINLLFLCWDWIFSIPSVTAFFQESTPRFYNFYQPLHINIQTIDLIFIGIYVFDIIVGWCISVFKKKERFYHYLLSHWYDIIGCIPAGSLVFLRLLRVVSIFIRLYKKKLVNLSKIAFIRKVIKVYNIILEEIADRVVLNILSGIKSNVRSGMPVAKEIIDKIIMPHKDKITSMLLDKLCVIAQHEYSTHKADLADYIKASSRRAVEGNKELAKLKLIPVVGNQITDTISKSVSQTVVSVVDNFVNDALSDTGQSKIKTISDDVTDYAFTNLEQQLSPIVTDIVVEAIALIARAAGVRQWKFSEIRERIAIAKAAENPDKDLIERLETEYQTMFLKEFEQTLGNS
ncbi:MAG: hypothetical protein J5595_07405 [Bacteroidales bacterium]|nr:hypothetical protein [Bacteroidales bacterium]